MFIKKLDRGTRIYLTKYTSEYLYIRPNSVINDESLYVMYDVKDNDIVVIPRGTRIVGDWIAETRPHIAAQFQARRIYLENGLQDIHADSIPITDLVLYSDSEIMNNNFLKKKLHYISKSNVERRIIKMGHQSKILSDENLDTIYIEIFPHEIILTLLKDFIAYPDFHDLSANQIYGHDHELNG